VTELNLQIGKTDGVLILLHKTILYK